MAVFTESVEDRQIPSATSSGKSSYTRQQKIILVTVLGAQFFVMTSISIPAPFLPRMDEKHGLNSDITGWLLGISSLIQLVLSPLVGKLIPHTGLHTMAVFGLFFTGGSTALFGVLEYLTTKENPKGRDIAYLALAFTLRTGQALGNTAYSTASLTILSVCFTETATTVMSYSETAIGLGVMAGPAIGSGFYTIGGFMATFAGAGALIITCSIAMYFLLPKKVGVESDGESESVSLRKVLSNINVIYGLILTSYSATVWACIDPILEPELRKKYGLSQELCALSFLLLSVTYSICAAVIGKCLDKLKWMDGLYVMLFGCVLMALNFIPMGPSPLTPWLHRPLWLLLTCVAVLGIGLGFTLIPSFTLLFGNSSSGDEGEAAPISTSTNAMLSSFWSSAYALGDWAGPVISGAVIKETNFGWTMTVYFFSSVAVVAVLGLKIYQALQRCCHKNSRELLAVDNQSGQNERTPLLTST